MIKRLKIEGYKSLSDLEVTLRPLSVLFGPNAAGKSNFLDALQLLSSIMTHRTLKEAFAPPYRGQPLESFTFGSEGIKGLLSRDSAKFSIEVDVELSPAVIENVNKQIRDMKQTRPAEDGNGRDAPRLPSVREKNLRYRIEVEVLPKSGILRVSDEFLAALNADGEVSKQRKPFLEQVQERLHLRMEGQAHPTYYERFLDHSLLSTPLYPPHYPHLVAARQELASWQFFYFEPRERMRTPNPVKEVRHIGLMGEDLASFLNTLRALDEKQFHAIEKSLHLIIPAIQGIDVSVSALGEVELRVIEGDTPVPARVLSEGTLRVIGLLALCGVRDRPALVGFEEPENGVHPRRIKAIAELLNSQARSGTTQFIVTTHSPVLLDLIDEASLLVCRREGRRTVIAPFTPWGELARDNPAARHSEIEDVLDDEQRRPVSERILRGDFDA